MTDYTNITLLFVVDFVPNCTKSRLIDFVRKCNSYEQSYMKCTKSRLTVPKLVPSLPLALPPCHPAISIQASIFQKNNRRPFVPRSGPKPTHVKRFDSKSLRNLEILTCTDRSYLRSQESNHKWSDSGRTSFLYKL